MDQTVFHLINEQWTNPALDLFMAAISNVEIWKPVIIGIALYALIFGGFKARACLLCLALALVVSEQFLISPLKKAVDRQRPKQAQRVRMVQLQKARPEFLTLLQKPTIRYSGLKDQNRSGTSFPSGHTANNVEIAVILSLFFGRWGALYFLVAAAIGWSRIYLGAHWPSDVLATAFLAAGEALLCVALVSLLWRWAGPRWFPRVFARHPHLLGSTEEHAL